MRSASTLLRSAGKRGASASSLAAPPRIHSSQVVTDRRSIFQAHAACVTSFEQAAEVREAMAADPALQLHKASHRIWCCVIQESGGLLQRASDDDGESGASPRLALLFDRLGCVNVLVLVSRRYGGTPLGNDRWKRIAEVAKQAIEAAMTEQRR